MLSGFASPSSVAGVAGERAVLCVGRGLAHHDALDGLGHEVAADGLVLGEVERVDPTAGIVADADGIRPARLVLGRGLALAPGVLHAVRDLAHRDIEAAAIGVVGDALLLPQLRRGAEHRGVATRLEPRGRKLHAGLDLEALGDTPLALEPLKPSGHLPSSPIFATSKMSENRVPFWISAWTEALSAWPRSTQLMSAAPPSLGRGLRPSHRVELARIELAGLVGDEHEEPGVGAVVGQIDGLPVRQGVLELVRDAAHGVVLGRLGLAALVDRDLGRPAIVVGIEDLAEAVGRGAGSVGIVAEVEGHRQVVVADLLEGRRPLDRPGVGLVLLAAEMRAPGGHRAGAGHPEAAQLREVDRRRAHRLEGTRRRVALDLRHVDGRRPRLEVRDDEQLVTRPGAAS